MDINVRNSLPTSQFGNESVETWLRDVYRRLEDLERRALPRTIGPASSGGGGAGVHLPFVTIGNTPQLTAERALSHDASLSHVDGGPNSSYTLGVVDNGHRHIEENIDETKYLVVDASGLGDYTSLTAALGHITDGGTNNDRWTIVVRSDLTENIDSWSSGVAKADINVHVWSLGKTRINGWVKGGSYGILHLHNFRVYNTNNFTDATLRSSNGGSIYAYDCDLVREEAIPVGPQGIVVDPSGGAVYLYRCKIEQVTAAEYPAIRFVNAGNVYAWDCDIVANVSTARGAVTSNIDGGLYLYHCKIGNVGTGDDISVNTSDGVVSVWRCQYDTTKVSGTGSITILDGDVPPPAIGAIDPDMIAVADSHIIVGDASGVGSDVAMSGDATIANTGEMTLATVNANVGTFGSATQSPQFTVNAKGLITGVTNVTITGVSPVASALTRGSIWRGSTTNVAEALALGAANKVFQSDGTDAGWSTYPLTIGGNSTINGSLVGNITGGGTLATGASSVITFPNVTGTALLRDANIAATRIAFGSDANTLTASAGLTYASDLLVLKGQSASPNVTYWNTGDVSERFRMGISGAGEFQFQGVIAGRSFYLVSSGGAQSFSTAFDTGNTVISGTLQSGVATHTGTASVMLTLNTSNASNFININENGVRNWAFGHDGGLATNAFFVYDSLAAKTPFKIWPASVENTLSLYQGKIGIGKATPATLIDADLTNATTNAVDTLTTFGHNTTGTAAAGFGGSIALNLESSTTADQAAAAFKWLWATATHASRKARVIGTLYDTAERQWLQVDTDGTNADAKIGGATTYLDVVDNGDAFFVGAGSGIPYASVSISDNATATTIALASTYVQVAFDTDGVSNLATPDHTNDHITVVKTGVYRIESHGDCHNGTVNNNYEIAVCKNNGATVLNGGLRTHIFFDFATSEPQFSLEDHVALTAGDTVELWVKNNTAGNNVTFAFASLMLEMAGG